MHRYLLSLVAFLLVSQSQAATWSYPFEIDLTQKEFPSHLFPRIAKAPNGYAVAVWIQYSGIDHSTLQFATKTIDEKWSQVEVIDTGMALYSYPVVVVDIDNNATIVWIAFDENHNAFLQAARLPFLHKLSPPITLNLHTSDMESLYVNAMGNEEGNIIVAGLTRSQSHSWATTLTASSTAWKRPIALGHKNTSKILPVPAVALHEDIAYVVWEENSQLKASRFAFKDSTWSHIKRTPTLPKNTNAILNWSASLDPDHNLFVLTTMETKKGDQSVWLTKLDDKAFVWSKPQLLSEGETEPQLSFIGIDKNYQGFIFWSEKNPNYENLLNVSFLTLADNGTTSSCAIQHIGESHQLFYFDPLEITFEQTGEGLGIWRSSLLNGKIEQGHIYLKKETFKN